MKTSDQDTKFAASSVDEQIDDLSKTQNEQVISSSLNAKMVHDLYQIYDHTAYARQLELSLGRIGQHLEAKKSQAAEPEKQHVPVMKVLSAAQQTKSRVNGEPVRAARSPIMSHLVSLAAVFLVMLLVGSLVLTLLATHHHGSNVVGNHEPETISVHMGPGSFLNSSVLLLPGMSVKLVNDNPVVHIIENGYWTDSDQVVLLHEPGMPKSPIQFEFAHEIQIIGPLHTSGVYHLFDEIHVNMNLTIQVQLSGTPGVVTSTPVKNAVRVYLEQGTFRPRTITIHKGMSILLTNDIPQEMHVIMNGYWNGNTVVYVVARGKPVPHQVQLNLQSNPTARLEYIDGQGVPIVDIVVRPWNSEQAIGPFMTTGTYSFFDTVHFNMNLTVVVK